LSVEQIENMLKDYENNTRAIKEDLMKICWFMRGSISYSECHMMTHDEKIIVGKLIEKNLQTTKDTGLPFF